MPQFHRFVVLGVLLAVAVVCATPARAQMSSDPAGDARLQQAVEPVLEMCRKDPDSPEVHAYYQAKGMSESEWSRVCHVLGGGGGQLQSQYAMSIEAACALCFAEIYMTLGIGGAIWETRRMMDIQCYGEHTCAAETNVDNYCINYSISHGRPWIRGQYEGKPNEPCIQ